MATWQDVRALRATPPGRAGSGGARQKTFAAALQQAHELATAAEHAGYASKPILLFYALSQAFRAICAARLTTDWSPVGHGLSVPNRGGDLLDVVIKAEAGQSGLYRRALAALGDARDEGFVGEVSIGALWAGNPELVSNPLPDPSVPGPLLARPLQPVESERHAQELTGPLLIAVDHAPEPQSVEAFATHLAHYPTLAGAVPLTEATGRPFGMLSSEETRNGVTFHRLASMNEPAPIVSLEVNGEGREAYAKRFREAVPGRMLDREDIGWIQPAIGSPPQLLDALSMWWLMLIGLSSIARYRPSEWSRALDIDHSVIGVPLERLLDQAESTLPHYVVQGVLYGSDASE